MKSFPVDNNDVGGQAGFYIRDLLKLSILSDDAKIEATTASTDASNSDKVDTTKKKLPYPRMVLNASQQDPPKDQKNTQQNDTDKK